MPEDLICLLPARLILEVTHTRSPNTWLQLLPLLRKVHFCGKQNFQTWPTVAEVSAGSGSPSDKEKVQKGEESWLLKLGVCPCFQGQQSSTDQITGQRAQLTGFVASLKLSPVILGHMVILIKAGAGISARLLHLQR